VKLAMGVSVHTGWAACVVCGGTLRAPRVVWRETIEMLGDPERFVYHRAAETSPAEAARAVARARELAVENARAAMEKIVAQVAGVGACAIVAKGGEPPRELADILSAHPRIHSAEGAFYRDALVAAARACRLEARVVDPRGLDPKAPGVAEAGKVFGKPWGRDEKIAALAAWGALSGS
jgi:hypothetical protein